MHLLGNRKPIEPSALQASSSSARLLSPPSSSTIAKHGPCLMTLSPSLSLKKKKKKNPGFRNQVPEENFPYLLLGAQDQRLGAEQDRLSCGSTGTFSDNCQETNTCKVHACYTPRQPLQKTSFRAPRSVGDDAVSRGNAGLTISKSGHPCSCQNCSQGPSAEKIGRGSRLNLSLIHI